MAQEEMAFKVEVRGARNLVPMDPNGQSDPYCKIGFADPQTSEFADPSKIARSKVHYVTLNPVWKGFSMIAKSTQRKIRVEVWDKDQGVEGDFEGLAFVDLSSIDDAGIDTWLPLTGRTDDEKVTGDVNIVITRGTVEELTASQSRSRSNSTISQSQELGPQPDEQQRVIKKLTSDLKTKSGRLDLMKENNSVLDQQVVKLKHQVELLHAEAAKKDSLLESKDHALAKANAYAAELQKALQEKQSVNKLVLEWNEKSKQLEQLQTTLKAKSGQQRRRMGQLTTTEQETTTIVGEQEMSVEKIVEEWTEYTLLIETLETQMKEKDEEVERSKDELQQTVNLSVQQIEELQFDIKELYKEIEKQRDGQLETKKLLEESTRELEASKKEVEDSKNELSAVRADIQVMTVQLEQKRDQDQQLHDVTIIIEKLQNELAEKSSQLNQQQVRLEEIKADLQIVDQIKTTLKEKEDELERMQLTYTAERNQEAEKMQLLQEEKLTVIQKLESEVARQGGVILITQEELTEIKTQAAAKILEQETIILKQQKTITELEDELLEARMKESVSLVNANGQVETESSIIATLTEQLARNTDAYSKLEAELKSTREKLRECERELDSKALQPIDLDLEAPIVVRHTKQTDQEIVVHDAGGAQFATHNVEHDDLLKNSVVAQKGKEEKELWDLEQELEALDTSQSAAPLLHIDLKYSLPKTPKAALAKQKRSCNLCK